MHSDELITTSQLVITYCDEMHIMPFMQSNLKQVCQNKSSYIRRI